MGRQTINSRSRHPPVYSFMPMNAAYAARVCYVPLLVFHINAVSDVPKIAEAIIGWVAINVIYLTGWPYPIS